MPTPQNENLEQMVNNVLEDYPIFPPSVAKRKINEHIRNIIARRPWSGLVRYNILSVPAQYSTGTIDVTIGSQAITGTATAWPTNDKVNTTVSVATVETGRLDMTPVSMTGIVAGVWVVVGQGTANQEAVFVVSVTATTFQANFTKTHAAAETILRSSLAGLQLRTGFTPFYTVTGILTSTTLLIDLPWATATATLQNYTIGLVYASLGQDFKMPLSMVNLDRHYQMSFHIPKAFLDYSDPRRTVTQTTFILAHHAPDPGGSPLYELYPRPTSQQAFPYFYIRAWDALISDYDILPNGIRSDVIVKRVKSDAARWPQHKLAQDGIYYDLNVSDRMIKESETDIENMRLEDDNTSVMSLMWDYTRWPYQGFGSEFWQQHDADGFFGSV
jgi:hypothetical protein